MDNPRYARTIPLSGNKYRFDSYRRRKYVASLKQRYVKLSELTKGLRLAAYMLKCVYSNARPLRKWGFFLLDASYNAAII